jgi:uncharacterized delta-60 repeat protein
MMVYSLVVQPDGKILVGGQFTSLGGASRNHLGRLNPDGSIDTGFTATTDYDVYTLALQADGKILVGGQFTTLAGETCNRIGRLTPEGALDYAFNGGADDNVYAIAQQVDGKILAGGGFSSLGGVARQTVGRVAASEAALQSFSVDEDGTRLEWLRGGSVPEFVHTTFEFSTDGIHFSPLGVGQRIPGGWQLDGFSLSIGENLLIKARGYYASGINSGSSSVIEVLWSIYLTPPPSYLYLPMILK